MSCPTGRAQSLSSASAIFTRSPLTTLAVVSCLSPCWLGEFRVATQFHVHNQAHKAICDARAGRDSRGPTGNQFPFGVCVTGPSRWHHKECDLVPLCHWLMTSVRSISHQMPSERQGLSLLYPIAAGIAWTRSTKNWARYSHLRWHSQGTEQSLSQCAWVHLVLNHSLLQAQLESLFFKALILNWIATEKVMQQAPKWAVTH